MRHSMLNREEESETIQPFSPHTKFFSSLKQVQKRLKSEHNNQQSSSTSTTQGSSSSSLSAPLYLYNTSYDQDNQAIINTQADFDLDSNPPLEFLSHHSTLDDIHTPLPSNVVDDGTGVNHGKNDIQEVLQQLGFLGIEDNEMGKSEMKNLRSGDDDDGGGGGVGSFYSKIVGMKGPKNKKEMDRLDGWIKYFLSNNDVNDDEGVKVKEPLRLIHLLIGRAIALANEEGDSSGDSGFVDMEFPSTVEEFLEHDPPPN